MRESIEILRAKIKACEDASIAPFIFKDDAAERKALVERFKRIREILRPGWAPEKKKPRLEFKTAFHKIDGATHIACDVSCGSDVQCWGATLKGDTDENGQRVWKGEATLFDGDKGEVRFTGTFTRCGYKGAKVALTRIVHALAHARLKKHEQNVARRAKVEAKGN